MSTEPRLPASIVVPALLRQIQSAGGFATLLSRGSPFGSAMIIVHRNTQPPYITAYERIPDVGGRSIWHAAAQGDAVESWLEKQRRFDPDLWIIELDIDDPARFVPGFTPQH